MSQDIYKDAIVTLAKAKTGAERLNDPHASVTLDNPLCGDRITLDLKIEDGAITEIGHRVRGCMLCEAAASMIGQHAVGTATSDIAAARAALAGVLAGVAAGEGGWAPIDDFAPVGDFKSRHECVLLPFEALEKAVEEIER
jgi:nitrogen fixation NifU-like protein